MTSGATGRRSVRLAGLAAVASLGLVVAYLWLVRTANGQRLDGTALEHRFAATAGATDRLDGLLEAIDARSVLLCSAALVLVALARRRVALAGATVVALGGSALAARALKDHLLSRDDLGFGGVSYNTFPSGHATVGIALALALVLAVPRAYAWVGAFVGTVGASLVGVAVLTTGGHRPSDAMGAYLATLAWSAACAVPAAALERGEREPSPLPSTQLAAGVGSGVLVVLVVVWRSVDGPARRGDLAAGPYVLGCLGMLAVAAVAVAAFAAAWHGPLARPGAVVLVPAVPPT